MKKRAIKKTNPRLLDLISLLKDASRQNEVNVWRDIASRLESPARSYAEVNLSKINRYASNGETIVVPGKVLGSGMTRDICKDCGIELLSFCRDEDQGGKRPVSDHRGVTYGQPKGQ